MPLNSWSRESAAVTGQIHAGQVAINGTVIGPVFAAELLALQSKAGGVMYKALEMRQGITITRQLRPLMGRMDDKPTLKLAANNARGQS